MVGKGAFGNAVLYRRKDDGLMCIIKEINMLDLNASDRQMALNEVKVLAKMDHPNISYYKIRPHSGPKPEIHRRSSLTTHA